MSEVTRSIMERGSPLPLYLAESMRPVVQLRIPLPDQVSLRATAAILRDLANAMEILSNPRLHTDEGLAILAAKAAGKKAQGRLTSIKRGVRKND